MPVGPGTRLKKVVADYGVKDSIACGRSPCSHEAESGSRAGRSTKRCVGMSADLKRRQLIGFAATLVLLKRDDLRVHAAEPIAVGDPP